jgi:nitrogenase molybdenum-iron protein alpha/beta subunit
LNDLEHFRLKTNDLGRLTGVSIALHAIPDAFLLMHCGVGCKHKATSKLSTHDWAENVVDREGWTEVGDAELIEGSTHRIGPYLRSWQKRVQPGLMAVISVTFLDLTGDDYKDEVRQNDEELPCKVIYVPAPGYDGDVYAGYASALVEVVKSLDWTQPVTHKTEVSVLGYLFDRYEGDHLGNLAQLRSLLKALGLSLGATLFSGAPYAKLHEAPRAGLTLSFPYAAPRAKRFKRLTKRELLQVDLPMGIAGTSRWLRVVGKAAQVQEERIQAVIQHKEAQVRKHIGMARQHLEGQRVAVFADVPLLIGLCTLLLELGLMPVLVGIRGHTLGGEQEFRDGLARNGFSLPDDLPVLLSPSLHAVRENVRNLLDRDQLDGMIGAATEFNAITTLPADTFVQYDHRGEPTKGGLFALEAGFPCKHYHVTRPSPFMGYAGVMGWADRLLNAPRLWDNGRSR